MPSTGAAALQYGTPAGALPGSSIPSRGWLRPGARTRRGWSPMPTSSRPEMTCDSGTPAVASPTHSRKHPPSGAAACGPACARRAPVRFAGIYGFPAWPPPKPAAARGRASAASERNPPTATFRLQDPPADQRWQICASSARRLQPVHGVPSRRSARWWMA